MVGAAAAPSRGSPLAMLVLWRHSLLLGMLLVSASESRRGRGRRANAVEDFSKIDPFVGVTNPCRTPGARGCCGDGVCEGAETEITCMADCPGVTTHETCGEEPHSDRGGKGRTFGVSFRAKSAQECCDKCKTHPKGCNSWTFCGYPVCFGLDTGWNHTFGELDRATSVRVMAQTSPHLDCSPKPRRVLAPRAARPCEARLWAARPVRDSLPRKDASHAQDLSRYQHARRAEPRLVVPSDACAVD